MNNTVTLIQHILSIIATIIPLLIGLITVIIKLTKNAKVKKSLQDVIKVAENLLPLIAEAEEVLNLSGAQKKEYVLDKVASLTKANGITFDRELTSRYIDELIAITKKVNV